MYGICKDNRFYEYFLQLDKIYELFGNTAQKGLINIYIDGIEYTFDCSRFILEKDL